MSEGDFVINSLNERADYKEDQDSTRRNQLLEKETGDGYSLSNALSSSSMINLISAKKIVPKYVPLHRNENETRMLMFPLMLRVPQLIESSILKKAQSFHNVYLKLDFVSTRKHEEEEQILYIVASSEELIERTGSHISSYIGEIHKALFFEAVKNAADTKVVTIDITNSLKKLHADFLGGIDLGIEFIPCMSLKHREVIATIGNNQVNLDLPRSALAGLVIQNLTENSLLAYVLNRNVAPSEGVILTKLNGLEVKGMKEYLEVWYLLKSQIIRQAGEGLSYSLRLSLSVKCDDLYNWIQNNCVVVDKDLAVQQYSMNELRKLNYMNVDRNDNISLKNQVQVKLAPLKCVISPFVMDNLVEFVSMQHRVLGYDCCWQGCDCLLKIKDIPEKIQIEAEGNFFSHFYPKFAKLLRLEYSRDSTREFIRKILILWHLHKNGESRVEFTDENDSYVNIWNKYLMHLIFDTNTVPSDGSIESNEITNRAKDCRTELNNSIKNSEALNDNTIEIKRKKDGDESDVSFTKKLKIDSKLQDRYYTGNDNNENSYSLRKNKIQNALKTELKYSPHFNSTEPRKPLSAENNATLDKGVEFNFEKMHDWEENAIRCSCSLCRESGSTFVCKDCLCCAKCGSEFPCNNKHVYNEVIKEALKATDDKSDFDFSVSLELIRNEPFLVNKVVKAEKLLNKHKGKSLIFAAVSLMDYQAVLHLLQLGADIYLRDKQGRNITDYLSELIAEEDVREVGGEALLKKTKVNRINQIKELLKIWEEGLNIKNKCFFCDKIEVSITRGENIHLSTDGLSHCSENNVFCKILWDEQDSSISASSAIATSIDWSNSDKFNLYIDTSKSEYKNKDLTFELYKGNPSGDKVLLSFISEKGETVNHHATSEGNVGDFPLPESELLSSATLVISIKRIEEKADLSNNLMKILDSITKHLKLVKQEGLLQGTDVHITFSSMLNSLKLLEIAVSLENVDIISLLLSYGAGVGNLDEEGSALQIASKIASSETKEIITKLLQTQSAEQKVLIEIFEDYKSVKEADSERPRGQRNLFLQKTLKNDDILKQGTQKEGSKEQTQDELKPPILKDSNWMLNNIKGRPCYTFDTVSGCKIGKNCKYAHVFDPDKFVLVEINDHAPLYDIYERKYGRKLSFDDYFNISRTGIDGRLWHTSAYVCPNSLTIYYSTNAKGGHRNTQNVWWFMKQEEAEQAVQKAVFRDIHRMTDVMPNITKCLDGREFLPVLENSDLTLVFPKSNKKGPCFAFRSGGCQKGGKCKYTHRFIPNTAISKSDYEAGALSRIYDLHFKKVINEKDFHFYTRSGRFGPFWHTAAFRCPYSSTLYYSAGGALGKCSSQRVWWYPTMKDAQCAVEAVVLADLKNRKLYFSNGSNSPLEKSSAVPRSVPSIPTTDVSHPNKKSLTLTSTIMPPTPTPMPEDSRRYENIPNNHSVNLHRDAAPITFGKFGPSVLHSVALSSPQKALVNSHVDSSINSRSSYKGPSDSLPFLQNPQWINSSRNTCYDFDTKGWCSKLDNCIYDHVFIPQAAIPCDAFEAKAIYRIYEKNFDIILSSDSFHDISRRDSEDRIWFTAAFKCPKSRTIYYAAGGSKGSFSSQKVWWYPTLKDAQCAVEGVVLTDLRERNLIGRQISPKKDIEEESSTDDGSSSGSDSDSSSPAEYLKFGNTFFQHLAMSTNEKPDKESAMKLPRLKRANWILDEIKKKKCYEFIASECKEGRKCKKAHFYHFKGPLPKLPPDPKMLAETYAEFGCKLLPSNRYLKSATTKDGEIFYTAAIECPIDSTIYFAAGGTNSHRSRQKNCTGAHLFWYPCEDDAHGACDGIVLKALTERLSMKSK